ncbi:MAG: MATE family efflux transporter [Porphyromonas sp.]|nr:MATE family efflux transporter [Porphyromonas sp.]
MRRRIYRLALPNIISNITVPLLSMVDVGLAGHLGEMEAIGAVAVASGVVSLIYWMFAFLRMGTTGFTAQAYGRNDVKSVLVQLCRGLLLALCLGLLVWLLREPLSRVGLILSGKSSRIASGAQLYMSYIFAGAPAALSLYVLNGWFVGMQNTRIPMWVAVTQNVINIALSFYLTSFVSMGVIGLAIGTVVAQYIGVLLLLLALRLKFPRFLGLIRLRHFVDTNQWASSAGVGLMLMLRTILLGGISLYFTYASARLGASVLAANTLLMQLFTLFSYFLDGFAYAGEALGGRYIGERRGDLFALMLRQLFLIGLLIALVVGLLYFLFPFSLLNLLTDKAEVCREAMRFVPWVALIPLCSFAAFLWDGVMVGATASGGMLGAMLLGALVFFMVYLTTMQRLGGHGLWVAFDLYLLARSLAAWGLSRFSLLTRVRV